MKIITTHTRIGHEIRARILQQLHRATEPLSFIKILTNKIYRATIEAQEDIERLEKQILK